MPDVKNPDESESGDEIRLENGAHDGDRFDLVYNDRALVHRTSPGGVKDVQSSGSLAKAHL